MQNAQSLQPLFEKAVMELHKMSKADKYCNFYVIITMTEKPYCYTKFSSIAWQGSDHIVDTEIGRSLPMAGDQDCFYLHFSNDTMFSHHNSVQLCRNFDGEVRYGGGLMVTKDLAIKYDLKETEVETPCFTGDLHDSIIQGIDIGLRFMKEYYDEKESNPDFSTSKFVQAFYNRTR